jgi:hypothetical protein
MAVIDQVKPATKPAAKKPAVKKPAAKKPAAKPATAKKAPVASVTIPPAAQALPVAKPAKKAVAKTATIKVPARLAKIFEGFAKGGVTRSESLGGKITKAQKAVLEKEAKRLGVTPAALVAALVINFLDSCAAE